MSEHVSREQLSLLVDGQLSLAAREAVVSHIRRCPACAERHDRLIELTAALCLHDPVEWSAAMTAATVGRLGDWRRPRRPLRPRRRGRDWSLPLATLLALVGGIALVGFAGSLFVVVPGNAAAFLPASSPAT